MGSQGNMSAPLVKLQCKPGEIVLYCSVPMSGVGYTYDIYCKPSDTILSVKEQIIAPDPHKSRQWKPERPKIALENMYLSVTSLGMLEDERTLESYGIGVGELNDWIGKQWIEILSASPLFGGRSECWYWCPTLCNGARGRPNWQSDSDWVGPSGILSLPRLQLQQGQLINSGGEQCQSGRSGQFV